jgi:flagellar L-ring protein precursor FlgH
MKRFIAIFSIAAIGVSLPGAADSLFSKRAAKEGTLVSNKKAKFEVGDIVTVLVRENIDASTRSDTNTKKESEVNASSGLLSNTFLTADKPDGLGITDYQRLPNWDVEAENEHKGNGSTRRSNSLVMTVACHVVAVQENGNVEIEGQKLVSVNREDSSILVKGIVRSSDVSATNTVESSQLADAVIQLKGQGPLWNNQRRGLVTKFLDWFSPF